MLQAFAMRPLTVLLGIVMGSTVAIAFGLAMVLIIFLILGGEHAQLRAERGPLLTSLGLFVPLAGAAVASFWGDLKRTPWRWGAIGALGAGILAVAWVYWP